ncbi:MAG: hypothetical protein RR425_07010, partial [Erysipelotrichales bacterium]
MKKKISLIIMLFLLVGCKDNPTKEFAPYLKGDIVIENGSIIKLEDLFELKVDNDISKKIKNSKVDIDYSKNQYLSEVNNKVVATNEVNVVYKEGNKEYKYLVPIKIKDTILPKITIKNTNPSYIVGDEFSLDILKEDLDYIISDASDVDVKLKGADLISTNKAKDFKVNIVVSDSGANIVKQDIIVSVLKPAIAHDFPFVNYIDEKITGSMQSLNLVIPSKYTTAHKVLISKRDYQGLSDEKTYNQQIDLKNGMIIDVYGNNKIPLKGKKIDSYRILDFNVTVYENKVDKYFVVDYGKSSIKMMITYDGSIIKFEEVKKILNEILNVSYIK